MLVQQILKSKTTTGVLTISPNDTIASAAKVLSSKKIGSLVVSEDGSKAIGILSERDIVREIGKVGDKCLSEKVKDLMTAELVTCAAKDTAESVLAKMTEGRFRHMPVVEGGALLGLITLGDVVKARLQEVHMEKKALEGMIMGH